MSHTVLAGSGNSIAQDQRDVKKPDLKILVLLWVVVTAFAWSSAAIASPFPDVRFKAESVVHEKFTLGDVNGQLLPGGEFSLSGHHALITGLAGKLSDLSVQGVLEGSFANGEVVLRGDVVADSYQAGFEVTKQPEKMSVILKMDDVDLLELKDLPGLPSEAGWLSRGHLDAELSYLEEGGRTPELLLQLGISELGFDSADGRFASEALAMTVSVSATLNEWSAPEVRGSITSGELLADDFYRNFGNGGLEFMFLPTWNPSGLQVRSFSLTDRSAFTVEGKASLGFGENADSWGLEITHLDLQFPGAYERYLEPMLAVHTLDGLGVTGQVSWGGEWSEGKFHSGDLRVTDLSLVDTRRNRFAFTGLDARMRPGDYTFDSRLRWRGLLVGRINLGPGEVSLDSEPRKFAIIEPLILDVLGGRMVLNELAVQLPGGAKNNNTEPDIRLRLDLENLDMEQLTAALDWPLFSGKISGHIPGVSLDDGVLDVEGKILVNVFDGALSLEDLRIERAFGVLPSLSANIEANNLDLEQLTHTFSFGQISGRIDGFIHELRMLDWKPVAFDAWFGTPASQKGTRDISRQAVNHLTTLGGGGATAALTGPVMKLFSSFSYKTIGMGCRMQNNVCDIRGVSEDDVSVLIMEGAGVPKVTIRAFNRRVDWPMLLSQLVAVSEGESVKVGD